MSVILREKVLHWDYFCSDVLQATPDQKFFPVILGRAEKITGKF